MIPTNSVNNVEETPCVIYLCNTKMTKIGVARASRLTIREEINNLINNLGFSLSLL